MEVPPPDRQKKPQAVGAMLLNAWIFLYIVALTWAVIQARDVGRLGVGAILFAATELPWWRVQDLYLQRQKGDVK